MEANYSNRGYQVYGDIDNLQSDIKHIERIIDNQGFDLILEVIANKVGNAKLKYKMTQGEVDAIKSSLTLSLCELIDERT